MKKTVLITGCSSGIGEAAAREFQKQGWQVAATMRNPESGRHLAALPDVKVYPLDVTKSNQIDAAVSAVEKEWGGIDALINNAGYGLFGPFETATEAQIRDQFETNFFGLTNLTRRVLPGMRTRKEGVIVNVGSVGSLVSLPMNSIYHATKFALHGFSLSLAYELVPFGIRVRLVAPGGVSTDFAGRSLHRSFPDGQHPYQDIVGKVLKGFSDRRGGYSTAEEIATGIYETAVDPGTQVLYVAGKQGQDFIKMATSLNEEDYQASVRKNFGL